MPAALIIPALNEEPILALTLRSIPRDLFDIVIVADNGSTDQTSAIALECGAQVVFEARRGYGAACAKAIEALPPGIDTVAFMQADLSERPEELKLILAPILNGRADLVIGSRTLGRSERGSLTTQQRAGNWLATRLVRLLYGVSFTDLGPFRAVRMDALRRIGMRDRGFGWTVEMQVRAIEEGLRTIEVPVTYRARLAGENKISGNWRASTQAGYIILKTVLRLWLRRFSFST